MRFIKLLSLPLVGIISVASRGDTEPLVSISSLEVVGNFSTSNNIQLHFTHNKGNELVTLKVLGSNTETGARYFSKTLSFASENTKTLTIDTYNYLSSTGLHLNMSFTYSGSIVVSKEMDIYPYKANYIYANRSNPIPVTIPNVCLGIINSNFITDETYDFSDTSEYFTKDSNNIVDLSEIKIRYSLADYFTYYYAYLEITDYEGIYSNLQPLNGALKIPVIVNANNNELSFEINTLMYVNPNTLEMSPIRRKGFESTYSLYVPIGREKDMEKNEYRLVIQKGGFSGSYIYLPLEFFSGSKLVGMCYDSEYCITGGIRA